MERDEERESERENENEWAADAQYSSVQGNNLRSVLHVSRASYCHCRSTRRKPIVS